MTIVAKSVSPDAAPDRRPAIATAATLNTTELMSWGTATVPRNDEVNAT